jgi:hypothetical protein
VNPSRDCPGTSCESDLGLRLKGRVVLVFRSASSRSRTNERRHDASLPNGAGFLFVTPNSRPPSSNKVVEYNRWTILDVLGIPRRDFATQTLLLGSRHVHVLFQDGFF